MQSDHVNDAMGSALSNVFDFEHVNSGLKSNLFYRPLADTLTFGLYSYLTGSEAPSSPAAAYGKQTSSFLP
jgi:hypothetical protein